MDILIIEDEQPAREKIVEMLFLLGPSFKVVAQIDSIKKGLTWFTQNPLPDLIIADIELLDGNVFSLFEQVSINCPVIFTTSYNEFLQDAFTVNSIAYIMKPFHLHELAAAVSKYEKLQQTFNASFIKELALHYQNRDNNYKSRFVVKMGKGIYLLNTDKIIYLQIKNSVVIAVDENKNQYPLNETLAELEELLNPQLFFRINRSEIINIQFIERIYPESNNCLTIHMKGTDEILSTSINRTPLLRTWLNR